MISCAKATIRRRPPTSSTLTTRNAGHSSGSTSRSTTASRAATSVYDPHCRSTHRAPHLRARTEITSPLNVPSTRKTTAYRIWWGQTQYTSAGPEGPNGLAIARWANYKGVFDRARPSVELKDVAGCLMIRDLQVDYKAKT